MSLNNSSIRNRKRTKREKIKNIKNKKKSIAKQNKLMMNSNLAQKINKFRVMFLYYHLIKLTKILTLL